MKWFLLLLVACGDNIPADDGFGEPCIPIIDGRVFTLCTTSTGSGGVCAVGICRRWCNGRETNPNACPEGQIAIPTIADRCWCEPP
jgi:hypothetical protein